MDEGASVPEVRHHTDSANVDAMGVWSEGDALYPGRPVVLLVEQVALKGATKGAPFPEAPFSFTRLTAKQPGALANKSTSASMSSLRD